MQGISLHCIAVTESLSYCVHHYSRSTSAGIFMERLHTTTAIFCSCQFLIFNSRPTFRHLAYSESNRRAGASPRPPEYAGTSNSRSAGLFMAIFGHFRRFFVKMADKTTVSVFLFRLDFLMVDIIESRVSTLQRR